MLLAILEILELLLGTPTDTAWVIRDSLGLQLLENTTCHRRMNDINRLLTAHLVVPAPTLSEDGDLLPPERLVPGHEAALAHDEVEEGAERHQQLETARDTGHGVEAELVDQNAGPGPGDEPPGPGEGGPHPGHQALGGGVVWITCR